MEAEDEIPRCRTLLCAVQTGGKYFGKLLQNMCENTVQKTFYNVLDENFYKHDILHLWKNDKCCLCGVSTVHHFAGSLKQRQILSVYSTIDRKCGRIPCKFCPCSYKAKEDVCTSNIDITFSHTLLSRVFLKSVHPSLLNVQRAIDEIKEIRNTAVHYPENPLHQVDFDKEWLNLKSSLLIICKYLKESTDMLEEEMEKFHYLVNTCKDCSFRIKASLERMKNGELKDSNDNGIVGNPFQMSAVCQECARIQEGCKDAQSLIFDNLHLFMGLTPYEFLPDLEEAGALTEEEVRHIKSLDKRTKQMDAFLSILKERGISSCRKTLDILAEKDYGPAIREMRKKKKAGCDITFAVNGNFDVEEVNALQQKTKDHTTEQSSGIGKYDLIFSVLGPRKDKIEKILKDFIESEDFSCKLKDMGPEDISVTNGSVIVHLTFKCQEDYDKFSVAVSEGKLFDIVSRMWDEVKSKHQINKQDANMIVYIQNVPGRLADSGKTECSAAFFIDTNNEFLTEELCSGTLIKYLKESHRDISEAIRIRKEHPFDRRAQSQELLKFLRNESFEFIQKCIFATQPETVKRKLEESMSSVHAVLETENKEKETMVEDTLLQTGTKDIIREKHAVLETENKEKETMVEDTLLQTGTEDIIREKHAVLETENKEKETMAEDTLLQTGTDDIIREKGKKGDNHPNLEMSTDQRTRIHNYLLYQTIAIDHLSPQVNNGKDLERFKSNCRNYLTVPVEIAKRTCGSLLQELERKGHIKKGKYGALKDIVNFSEPLLNAIEKAEKMIEEHSRIQENPAGMNDLFLREDFCKLIPEGNKNYEDVVQQLGKVTQRMVNISNKICAEPEFQATFQRFTETRDESVNLLKLIYCIENEDEAARVGHRIIELASLADGTIQNTEQFKNWEEEWRNHNNALKEYVDFICRFSAKGAKVRELFPGSILIKMSFERKFEFERFMGEYHKGDLQKELQEILITKKFLQYVGLSSAEIEISIDLNGYPKVQGMTNATKMSSSAYAPTQETTNLNRVSHVLRCPCTDQLRDLLRHHVPPVLFPGVIQEEKTNLPRLTAPQRELILPSTGHYTGDYSDMDVSLLYLLLRNICNIQPHRNGWGHSPDDTDFSLSACIDRIREIRNKIGHSTSRGLSQIDFIDQWSDIKRSVKSIDKHLNNDNKYEKDVDCLLEASMGPELEAFYLGQLKSKVKTEGIEDLRSLVASINELEADRIQILSFRMDDAIDLDRIYASVSIIDEYDKRGSMKSEDSNFQCIAPDKIFSTKSGNLARFIFMLGEAGYGKTVQCQRFAKSWCQAWNNDTVRERGTRPQISDLNRCLKQFDFLFFIKMRDVSIQSENLIDLIQDVYSRYRLSKQNLADMRMVLENGEFRSLVLLDGLDEWNKSDDKKKLLLDKCIPNCRNMPGTTILISMRSWKFMEVEEVCNPNSDRVIRLNGLDEDGVKELTTNMLSNYFQNKTTFDDFNERKAYVENAVSYAPTEIKSLMNIPMLTVFYILTLYEDVKTANSLTTFYLSIIEALFKRMSRKAQAEGIRGEFSISTFVRTLSEYLWNRFRRLLPRLLLPGGSLRTDCISLQEYPKVAQHLHELTRLGKVAFETLCSEKSILVFSEDQLNQQLDEEIVDMFLRVGLVIKSEATGRFHEDKIRISFLHKTIHEFLASLYLIYGRKETDIYGIMKDVLLINVDKAIEYTPVLIFLSGLSPAVGCRLSSFIKNMTNDDDEIHKYRVSFNGRSYNKVFHLYNLQLRCYKEVRGSKSIEAFEDEGHTLKFSFSDVILLSTDTDVHTIRESAKVLKFHPNDIVSLNMVCIPNNETKGISNTEVKNFLDESKAIESIYIDGYVDGKCRLIDDYSPKMFHLKTVGLANVAFRDNILANLITKDESKAVIRALGILFLKSEEDEIIDFEYRIPSIYRKNTTKLGFLRHAHPKKTGAYTEPQRKQKTPFLSIFLGSLPDYKQLSILHITYMEAEEDRQKLLQVLPKLSQLRNLGYSGSSMYRNRDEGYDPKVLSKIANLGKLEKVNFRFISLDKYDLNFENMSDLKDLTLEDFKMPSESDWEALFNSLCKLNAIQNIHLYDTDVPMNVVDEYKNNHGSVHIEIETTG